MHDKYVRYFRAGRLARLGEGIGGELGRCATLTAQGQRDGEGYSLPLGRVG